MKLARVKPQRGPNGSPALVLGTFAATLSLALLSAMPLMVLSGVHPQDAYLALVQGSVGSSYSLGETVVQSIPLVLGGLAVALAFQAGLFNIGVEGQLIVGAMAAAGTGIAFDLPPGIHVVAAVLAAAAAGAAWSFVPGLLKAWRGVHEVISTIMFNYIAFSLSRYMVAPGRPLSSSQPSASQPVDSDARLPLLTEGSRVHAGLVVALVAVVVVAWLLYRTPAGFNLRLVGASSTAARFHGINVGRTQVSVMAASGALAGIAGGVEVLGLYGQYIDSFSPGYGFQAIAIALLGMLTPVGCLFAAVFFGMLSSGSVQLQASGVSRELISVVSGLVVAFVAVQPYIIGRLLRRRRGADAQPPPAAVDVSLTT